MGPSAKPRFKVCCVRSPAEARAAIDAGAAAIGLVSRMPSGPGIIALDVCSGLRDADFARDTGRLVAFARAVDGADRGGRG